MSTTMKRFIQLTAEDCTYLLELIEDLDGQTAATARQRGYTVPKLGQIAKDPRSARLASQDIEYLIELIQEDDIAALEQQRTMTWQTLYEIQELRNQVNEERRSVEEQRATGKENRRARYEPVEVLAEHFAGPKYMEHEQ